MVATLSGTNLSTKIAKAQERLGKAVHVGYPFLQEAKVVKVTDELFEYVMQGDEVVPKPHDPPAISQWKKKVDRIERFYSRRLGVVIGDIESLVHVDMLRGLRKMDDGSTVKEYAEIPGMDQEYATQTIVDYVSSPDARFLERAALSVEEEYPEGSRAFFLGDLAYGRPLEVLGHKDGKIDIWLGVTQGKEKEFGQDIAASAERLNPYTPAFAVARQLALNGLVLSKLTSAFRVQSSGLELNLGLNLKFQAKGLKVLGYSRMGRNGWEYSPKAINLIVQYMTQFPEFIAGICRNPQGDSWKDTDFYPGDNAKEKVKEIIAWLKSVETKSFEKVPLDAEQLDSDIVMAIERAADDSVTNGSTMTPRKVNMVPRHALLHPTDAEQRIGEQHFSLGDRIVYVLDSGKVPIGFRGTVVGKTRTSRVMLLDVVFDVTFMGGTTLNDRCSPFRGSTVPITAVLNITDRQILAQSQAQQARNPAPVTQPFTVQNRAYGAPASVGGQAQLYPANAPAPLRGSFRGAVAGQRGGGRGPMPAAVNGHQQQQLPIRGGPPANGFTRGGFAPRQTPPTQPQQMQQNGAQASRGGGFAPRGRGASVPQGPAAGVNGHTNGVGGASSARGRGRGGYTQGIDNTDPTEGVLQRNPNFKPQDYSAVPPPAGLEMGRGRGRGRGGRGGGPTRGGGDRGRGRARGAASAPEMVEAQVQ